MNLLGIFLLSKIEPKSHQILRCISDVLFHYVLHNDPVQRNISTGQDFLVQKLIFHKRFKNILMLRGYPGQNRFIRLLLQFVHLIYMLLCQHQV